MDYLKVNSAGILYLIPRLLDQWLDEKLVDVGYEETTNEPIMGDVLDKKSGETVSRPIGYNVVKTGEKKFNSVSHSPWHAPLDEIIFDLGALVRMHSARMFSRISEGSVALAMAVESPSLAQSEVLKVYETDKAEADMWLEAKRAENKAKISALSVEDVDRIAEQLGHELSGSTKSAKIKSLTDANLI